MMNLGFDQGCVIAIAILPLYKLFVKVFFKTLRELLQLQKWRRAHNSSPHKWYCHFWDWHNWYLTLLIKLKLILVNFGTLNYWYWAQIKLTLLKFDISDLQNDWHLQLLTFGIIGISRFWFLKLFVFNMSIWYKRWLIHDITDIGIIHIWNFWYWTIGQNGLKFFIWQFQSGDSNSRFSVIFPPTI